MPIKKKGLGKGLDSLIPDNKSMKSVTSEKTVECLDSRILPAIKDDAKSRKIARYRILFF